tara:strand:+ start:41966 stop:43402 length:1437 start_codon:yes stop_codon:yes gene_type:complete
MGKGLSKRGSVRKIGFIGLGNMGMAMARNLIKAGFTLTVYDIERPLMDKMKAIGAQTSESPAGISKVSDLVWMQMGQEHMTAVLSGEQGVLKGANPGTILIDGNNPNSLDYGLPQYKQATDRGLLYLDATVSNAPRSARQATLSMMVGGDKNLFENNLKLFNTMASNVFYMGPPGSGHKAKLLSNMIQKTQMRCLSEMMTLISSMGIDVKRILQKLRTSTSRSWVMDRAIMALNMTDDERKEFEPPHFDESPGPTVKKTARFVEVGLGIQLGHNLNISLPLTSAVNEIGESYASRLNQTIVSSYNKEPEDAKYPLRPITLDASENDYLSDQELAKISLGSSIQVDTNIVTSIINKTLLSLNIQAVSEGITLANEMCIELNLLLEALSTTACASPALDNARIISDMEPEMRHQYEPGGNAWMKSRSLLRAGYTATNIGHSLGQRLPLTSLNLELQKSTLGIPACKLASIIMAYTIAKNK